MNTGLLMVLGLGVLVTIVSIFYLLIKPYLGKKPVGYISAPHMRPAHSFIIDKSLHRFGVGEVIGSERLARDKVCLRIRSSSGILNAIYYDYEIEPTNVFDSVCGEGNQTFVIKEGIYTSGMDIQSITHLKGEITNLKNQKDIVDRENTEVKNNISSKVDDVLNRFLEHERAKRPSKRSGIAEE